MLERINGFSESGVLGYFMGKNALVSVAISGANTVVVKVTGAVCSFVELQRFLNTQDPDTIVEFLNDKKVTRVDGTEFIVATIAGDYTAAYSAQTNVKRIIDVVQQRAVIIATSLTEQGVDVAGFKGAPNGVSASVAVDDANLITFLVERANVFDLDVKSMQGVPSTTVDQGRCLVDDLSGVPLLKADGTEQNLLSSATATTAGTYGIKVYYAIPALSI